MKDPFVRKALLQETAGDRARCLTCERRCLLAEGAVGWCRTRKNVDGELVTLIYGNVSSLSANPIEKKPLYHFHPGTVALTAGSWSCNFNCPWCQNWDISKQAPPERGDYLSPVAFIEAALERGCQGTSISFNEPTLSLEWSLDVFRLAREQDLYNTYVTNGYMTAQALEMLFGAGLDAMNVDIKGDAKAVSKYCGGVDVELVWERCRQARELGLHLEITTLVIPGVNDAPACLEGIAKRIAEELGPATPWHVTRYHPDYLFQAPATPIGTIEQGWEIGRRSGLRFVYAGNLPGHPYDNTTCPNCGALIIERVGFLVRRMWMRDGCCADCGEIIEGVGW